MRTSLTASAHLGAGALMAALAALLGAACLFSLSEQDVFWQIRAGDELWRTGAFPTQDSWTFTVPGAPWRNFEWLSTLLLRGLFALGGVAGLVLCRGLCVAVLCAQWSLIARRAGASVFQAAALTMALWVAALPRLQLRPELFVLLCLSGLQALWLGPRSHRTQRVVTAGTTLLAANLHPGVTPLLSVCAAAWGLSQRSWVAAAACLLAPLCTPNGVHVLPFLWSHADYFAQGVLANPEHQPMRWTYLASPSGIAAAALLAMALAGCKLLTAGAAATAQPRHAPPRWLASAWLLLALLALARTRALPFACIAALPHAAAWSPRRRSLRVAQSAAAAALCLGAAAPLMAAWGLRLDPVTSPARATAFLQARRPQARLLHNYIDGAYLVWFRREAPDFVDPRETPFWGLEQALSDAFGDPEAMEALTRRFQIDTVLLPIPEAGAEALRMLLPAESWPLIYFDATRLLLARRDTDQGSAYRWLDPTMPANAYAHGSARTRQTDQDFGEELARCLNDDASNAWCLIARGALLSAQGDRRRALSDLSQAHAHLPSDSPLRVLLAAELGALIARKE